MVSCPLCNGNTVEFSIVNTRIYHRCTNCDGISVDPSNFLLPKEEEARYQLHNNDISSPGYQKFVGPIVSAVIQDYNGKHKGLDFGSGTTSIVATLLRDCGYSVETYDPFFSPNTLVLQNSYDFISCCEVMEHFHYPEKEFKKLYQLLTQGGRLYCKTYLYKNTIDFDTWWYKNDPTHVFFYTDKTLHWICDFYGYSNVRIKDKLITFLV